MIDGTVRLLSFLERCYRLSIRLLGRVMPKWDVVIHEGRRIQACEAMGVLPGRLWWHASSVGEVRLAARLIPLMGQLAEQCLTVQTLAGMKVADTLLPELDTYLMPRDFPRGMETLFRALRPRALLLIETELWPVQLWVAQQHQVPVCVVNARISNRTFPWYKRARPLFGSLLTHLTALCRSEVDWERFVDLGVAPSRARVIGDLKLLCDGPGITSRSTAPELLEWFRGGPVVILACPTGSELEILLKAHAELCRSGGGGRLLVAPRHPKARGRVHSLAPFVHRSELGMTDRPPVLVLDSIGELSGVFSFAAGVIMGGTWTGTGGHSMLDAARCGGWVVYGPRVSAVAQQQELIERAGVGVLQDRLDVRQVTTLLEMLYRTGQDEAWRRSRREHFEQALIRRSAEVEQSFVSVLGRWLEDS